MCTVLLLVSFKSKADLRRLLHANLSTANPAPPLSPRKVRMTAHRILHPSPLHLEAQGWGGQKQTDAFKISRPLCAE